ncbi:hypothetical protein BIWAKO_04880 [Bosea sp. BIWAKO-01]|nr:hypothetical protein BIWAKO_04880 [Bosea sp. BIWAKO-01]
MAPDALSPVSNAWGRRGWTTADLSRLSLAELAGALEAAWRLGAQKKPRRR